MGKQNKMIISILSIVFIALTIISVTVERYRVLILSTHILLTFLVLIMSMEKGSVVLTVLWVLNLYYSIKISMTLILWDHFSEQIDKAHDEFRKQWEIPGEFEKTNNAWVKFADICNTHKL